MSRFVKFLTLQKRGSRYHHAALRIASATVRTAGESYSACMKTGFAHATIPSIDAVHTTCIPDSHQHQVPGDEDRVGGFDLDLRYSQPTRRPCG
jgi:hypothetical protein